MLVYIQNQLSRKEKINSRNHLTNLLNYVILFIESNKNHQKTPQGGIN